MYNEERSSALQNRVVLCVCVGGGVKAKTPSITQVFA